MSSRRLVAVPLLLFATVSGGVFGLAKLHLARSAPAHTASLPPGDASAGRTVFSQKCAACHGAAGAGGGIGPRLAGVPLPLAAAQTQIDTGSGVMPAGLVTGQQESDVLAYLATILEG